MSPFFFIVTLIEPGFLPFFKNPVRDDCGSVLSLKPRNPLLPSAKAPKSSGLLEKRYDSTVLPAKNRIKIKDTAVPCP